MPSSGSHTGTPITGGGAGLGNIAQGLPYTLLPPSRYAEIMQISLPHFMQLNGVKAPLLSGCDDIWDMDGRELLVWTMQQAEELIANELGFWPAPKFITNENHALGLNGVRGDWTNAELQTDYGYVVAYGTETLTLLQADAVVQYSVSNNNPFDRENLAVIGTSLYADLPACANPCDVAVFFRVADGAIDAADSRFEIRPLAIDIDGSTMHITGESSLFVIPTLWNLTEHDAAGSDDPNIWRWDFDVSNLVGAVDVYCRTVNTTSPVTILWDGSCHCTTACSHESQTACAYETDLKRGFFTVRPDTGCYHTWMPERVRVNYKAGYPLDPQTCRMNANLERAIVKLTNVLLPEPPCAFCDAAQVRWKQDRTNIDPLTPEAASMPWDLYSMGALEAWRIVKRFAMGRGGKLGR
jgi:hypothetical protein